ncbi:MAG TPA: hypothetical protein VIY69_17695 [Candidatus Acidoferrales bacterium]
MRTFAIRAIALAAFCLVAAHPALAQAQPGPQVQDVAAAPDPASALADILSAACRGDEKAFGDFFTADNVAAYRALPPEERKRLMQRFSLSDDSGKPMLSSDQNSHNVIRCERAGSSTQFRFGATRVHDNLAFIPVTVVDGQSDDFGLVRENGGWKLLSLGLVLLDIKQLSVQWAASDLAARETAAAEALETLGNAISSYDRGFGKLPDSLAQLGPGTGKQVTPDKAALVSAALAAGSDGGYRFIYRAVGDADSSSNQFVLEAVPQDYGTSGRESFFRDARGQIHEADNHGASASADDPVWHEPETP